MQSVLDHMSPIHGLKRHDVVTLWKRSRSGLKLSRNFVVCCLHFCDGWIEGRASIKSVSEYVQLLLPPKGTTKMFCWHDKWEVQQSTNAPHIDCCSSSVYRCKILELVRHEEKNDILHHKHVIQIYISCIWRHTISTAHQRSGKTSLPFQGVLHLWQGH